MHEGMTRRREVPRCRPSPKPRQQPDHPKLAAPVVCGAQATTSLAATNLASRTCHQPGLSHRPPAWPHPQATSLASRTCHQLDLTHRPQAWPHPQATSLTHRPPAPALQCPAAATAPGAPPARCAVAQPVPPCSACGGLPAMAPAQETRGRSHTTLTSLLLAAQRRSPPKLQHASPMHLKP